MMGQNILAIDQGTTSTRSIVFDRSAQMLGSSQVEVAQYFPKVGWVEQDPTEILSSVILTVRRAIEASGLKPDDIATIGIANQRETTIVWDRKTGNPVANAIVWQCRRTAEICDNLVKDGHADNVRQRTGLMVDPYFSATKLRWLLDNIPDGQSRAERGDLRFGTVDSWLISKLTGNSIHRTDVTNASRTMLLNLHEGQWDTSLIEIFDIPKEMLPEIVPSSSEFGITDANLIGATIPITGVAGDQHAALYGQACFQKNMVKCTYGTGAFMLQNSGNRLAHLKKGLLSTIAWQVGSKKTYALEGSIFATGASIQWLRDGLKLMVDVSETEDIARSVPDNGGVYLVPAFVGLGAPHWRSDVRGLVVGLTRGTTGANLVRAALEATAFQVRDLFEVMNPSVDDVPRTLRVDGGQTTNKFLMQFQADILDRPVEVAASRESTALGAAFLAGRSVGIWKSDEQLESMWGVNHTYEPRMPASERNRLYEAWQQAVHQTLSKKE